MAVKKWYTNVYILLTIIISCVAVAMAALTFVLLPQSAEIIRIMQWRTVRARSFNIDVTARYEGSREVKGSDGAVKKYREAVAFGSRGPVDVSDQTNETLSQVFRLSVGAEAPATDVAGEFRRRNGTDYVDFSALPDAMGSVKLTPYRDKWLSFDIERLRRSIDSPFFGAPGRQLDEFDRQYLLDQFRLTPFLRFVGKLSSETIGGVAAHHYQVRPEILFIKDYVIQSEGLRLGRELTAKERDFLDTFFANVTAEDGEVWVGKRDYYLYRMRLRFRYDDGLRNGTLSLTMNFSAFNAKPPETTAPSSVENVDEILRSLLPSAMEHLPMAGQARVRQNADETYTRGLPVTMPSFGQGDQDKDGLSDALESFYGTDPKNPDTDGDGVKDGDEVNNGMDPNGPGKLFDFGLPFDKK